MSTVVELKNIPAFSKKVKNITKMYRAMVMSSLSVSLDKIRFKATDYIVKRDHPIGKDWTPYKAAQMQPSNPIRVTERTGLLVKMLKNYARPYGGAWSVKPGAKSAGKTSSMTSAGIKGMIKTTGGYGTLKEEYIATLRVAIGRAASYPEAIKYLGHIRDAFGKRTRMPGTVKQQLALRFKHDTGIRGKKRPNISIAAQKEKIGTARIIQAKIDSLGGVI